LKNQTINILPLRENGMNYEMSLSTYTVVSIVIQQFSSYVSENWKISVTAKSGKLIVLLKI